MSYFARPWGIFCSISTIVNFSFHTPSFAFSFSTLVTKTVSAFLWQTGENEYRQKAFRSYAGKWRCRYPGGFQRRAGEACLWHTILLARSSVLYLLFRGQRGDVAFPDSTPLPAENGGQKLRRDEQSLAAVFIKEASAECNEAHASGGTRGI